ncbi:unnamed protein product [Aphanomyces euteiches]|uniref:BTB domain-containing protein n=1 Tax=Aphanomyces euteiches TaxID=100861 RepID=A0A6G0WUF7_9STRA|nr:hypothetical protein Ae201684_011681 [Aphanomyces euteiches]KAH9096928.1 hypothetical protein Ae201684P_011662 [Aphanomyces euteiches]KAH9116458.1 hypothetical protein AeMF1_009600 [Aphanomyces euteiches]KAH9121794.1 hypothetical protein LEN26_010517 [Aphanomyces euteiches]KAH9156557.1 hypothetical protein AeRB84_001545 [Aphanomyces euteiches]
MSKASRGSLRSNVSLDEAVEAMQRPKTAGQTSEDTIVIHVCDEVRKVNKDFVCNKTLLLDNMKYFKAYLNDASAHEDIDISVHCDVSIFEWLFRYIHADESNVSDSTLGIENVTSILISSDFLQMDFLVSECVTFISQHLEHVVDMPGDLLCISDAILEKIADLSSFEQLDGIEATKDKLCYKLYSKRLNRMVSSLKEQDGVACCVHCGVVYFTGHESFLSCRRAKQSVGIAGNVISTHDPKPDWKLDIWVKSLTISFTARQAFWKVWGALQCLYCHVCRLHFTATELNECYYHNDDEVSKDENCYGCCGVKRFAADARPCSGCKVKQHAYNLSSASQYDAPELLERMHMLVASHADVIAREPPTLDPPNSSKGSESGIHEMLLMHVKPQVSMLASCDVSNDLMKTLKSSQPDVSTPQTRKQWKIDLLQEKDRIRVQMLSSALTKMRVEYKVARG